MKKQKTLALVFALGIGAQAFAGNIIVNPGFETTTMSGWTTSAFSATNNEWHSGAWSAITSGNNSMTQSFAPVDPNSITEVSYWVKALPGGLLFSAIDFLYTDSTTEEFVGGDGNSASVWTQMNFTSQLNLSKTLSGIRIWGNSASTIVIDDVMVNTNPVPEPTSLAFLSLGSLILLRRRRK